MNGSTAIYLCFLLFLWLPRLKAEIDQSEKYLCKDNCNVRRERCNCTDTCVEDLSCCSDYEEVCLGQQPWVEKPCASPEEKQCEKFSTPPLILFSIDGFKAEYIYRERTPNIWKLASCGVHAPYMRSVYPTSTFPNHHSIATGLYPESHGIVENSMYDHDKKEEFYLGSPNAFHPFWWGGEPIWITTRNQGKVSATYFWPGTDVNITNYPNYYYVFNGSVPNEERMYQALDWLDLPSDKRPDFITLYVSSVDHTGHVDGPNSESINRELDAVDQIISILMNGLKLRGIDNCVNIIILADHGMAPQSCDRLNYIDQYGVNTDVVDFYGGAFGRVGKSRNQDLWEEFNPKEINKQLRCHHDESHWQTFLKYEYLPKRLHYAKHDRIEDVQLIMDDEWLVGGEFNTTTFCSGGGHGFDNEYRSMHALFTAHGPGFKTSYNTTEPFANIEVYNLMTDLLGLTPAPNNGTPGSLYHIMSNPKQKEPEPEGTDEALCISAETDWKAENDLGCNYCSGLSEVEANKRMDPRNDDVLAHRDRHMLYGKPIIYGHDNSAALHCVLVQEDYAIAYEFDRKMARYVEYTLSSKDRDLLKPENCSRPDYRVNALQQTSCSAFTDEILQTFLYPPELSNQDAVHDAVINTNVVPMYAPATKVWNYMSRVFADWATSYGGINVISGPIHDNNYDGLLDSPEIIQKTGRFLNNTPIPTHFFIIVRRCLNYDEGQVIEKCANSPDDLEVLSFIIPNYMEEPCHKEDAELSQWIPGTILEHVARMRDIELLAGISFFPDWTSNSATQGERLSTIRKKLGLPQFSSQWLTDFLASDLPSGGVSYFSFSYCHYVLHLLSAIFIIMQS